ncbi:MAG TPA: hypothetical protein VGY57_17065 [Vicinamibacterales bacterium]|nr:hypothetical protein [Vicinamibacterales bacterium]
MTRRGLVVLFSVAAAATASSASAQNLVDLLPLLLKQGAVIAKPAQVLLPTQVDTNAIDLSQSFVPAVTLTTVPQQLNAALALQLSTGSLGPMAGTVIYSRDGNGPEMHQAFGGAYADRGRPMGRGKVGLAMTFQNDNYTTFDGVDLNGGGINFLFANAGPTPDTSDVLQETVSYRLNRKTTSFVLNYGATNRLDLRAVVPIVQVAMDIRVQSRILRVRSSLDTLASCAAVPARNAGLGPALALCQDPHGFDTALTLGTHDTYLDLAIGTVPVFNNYGLQGKTARGVGDVQLGAKYALVSVPSEALAVTLNASLPTGNSDNFLGNGAYRTTPGIAWSASVGRVSPHVNAGYTISRGNLSSALLTNTSAAPDLKVPDEINWAAGLDAAVAPRTTLVTDVVGRTMKNVQRFATGTTRFATGVPNYPADVAASTDLVLDTRGDLQQVFGTIGGRVNLAGSIFANATVMFPVVSGGLKPKPSAAFWIDYAF